MLGIADEKRRAEVAEDLGHQFVLLAEKMGDGYLAFSNLVKSTWKETIITTQTNHQVLIAAHAPQSFEKYQASQSTPSMCPINTSRLIYRLQPGRLPTLEFYAGNFELRSDSWRPTDFVLCDISFPPR